MNISEKCRQAGIDRRTYYRRLARGETDLFAPLIRQRKPKRSVPNHIKPILKENGICHRMYFARLNMGWSEFEASHVLPNSYICHCHDGKTIRSQLDKSKYRYYLKLINRKGLSPEEAFERVTKDKNANCMQESCQI